MLNDARVDYFEARKALIEPVLAENLQSIAAGYSDLLLFVGVKLL